MRRLLARLLGLPSPSGELARVRPNLLRSSRSQAYWPGVNAGYGGASPWAAGNDSRLNGPQWAYAHDSSINWDLENGGLETVRQRAALEAKRNPIVAGVIKTHVDDVVGPYGPKLRIRSSNRAYDRAAEGVWNAWWAMPDVNGVLSGVEILRLDVETLWPSGEFIHELLTVPEPDGPVSLGLSTIHPRRLMSPIAGPSDVRLGVRCSRLGRPLSYFIAEEGDYRYGYPSSSSPVDADSVIHGFHMSEPGQIRGVPYLASSLQAISDLREFGIQTLDAARNAADFGVMLHTDEPDEDPIEYTSSECYDIERGKIQIAPPGWKVTSMGSSHPGPQFVDFVRERLREIGRPVSMPLLMILLDASKHNYSGARFDSLVYRRSIRAEQAWLERVMLNRLLRLVELEAYLAGALPRRRPKAKRVEWIWPSPPEVDPDKHAKSEERFLANGTQTYADACGLHGSDADMQLEALAREVEDFRSLGLRHPYEREMASEVVESETEEIEA